MDERTEIARLTKYLEFKASTDEKFIEELIDAHPECIAQLWRFFCGNMERREKYADLFEIHEAITEYNSPY